MLKVRPNSWACARPRLGSGVDNLRQVELPDELYLRQLADLDLDDPEAIAAFTGDYGRLVRLEGASPGSWPQLPDLTFDEDPLGVRTVIEQRAADRGETWHERTFHHVREVAAHAVVLRNATRLWRRYLETGGRLEGTQGGFEWAEPFAPPDDDDPSGPIHWLSSVLNAGLRDFHVRMEWTFEADPPDEMRLGDPRPTTYGAMCLQLANHMVEESPYRSCANELCGRWFVHQRGRARYGQHRRTGVKYCSTQCAQAQTSREHRRRRRGGQR